MDQLKEFLKLAVKYRFWIVVAVAALLPMIGFFASAGPINEQETTKAAAVKTAFTNVKKYESGIQPNDTWRNLTEQRTGVLKSEIHKAWEMLYEQQAPLLTWPPEVSEQYTTWGPRWPEGVSPSTITLANNTYAAVYPQYVDQVYASFRPFNYEDGSGVVVAPVKETLLRPVKFSASKPPTLGKVWAAQQKLWIQRTVLDVIDKVNSDSENWDEAPLKQITGLEVANPKAQDQKSIVEGISLVLAPEITRPGDTSAAPAAASSGGGGRAASDYEEYGGAVGGGQMGQMMSSMGGYGSGMGMMGGAALATEPDEVYIFEQASGQQFREIPVYIAVLIDQSRVLDLIEAFRRSPMSIQVVDFELKRPDIEIKKPEKGEQNPMFSSLGGYGEMFLGANSMMSRMGGMMGGMGAGMGMPGYGAGMEAGYEMMSGGMGGYGPMGARAPTKPQGKDIASEQYKKLQERQAKADGKTDEKKAPTPPPQKGYSDPHYNIVEVHIYGRARFYDPPTAEEAQPESLVDTDMLVEDEVIAGDESGDASEASDVEMLDPTEPAPSLDASAEAPSTDDGSAPEDTPAQTPVDETDVTAPTEAPEPVESPEPGL